MKRELGRVECNTKTARKIASADGVTLYKTKSRRFFVEDSDELRLMGDAEAREWLTQHCGADFAAAVFTDEDLRRVVVDLPVELVDKIDAAKTAELKTRRAVIQAALENSFR